MRSIAAIFVTHLMLAVTATAAAPVDTLTPAQMSSATMTVEQLLGVPSSYTVIYCRMLMSHRGKGVCTFFYCPDSCAGCATVSARDFPGMWSEQLNQWLVAGYNFILTDIEMQCGSRVMHWQQKSFAAPR
ncbi:MAG: hypothetical protein JST90_18315 [Bacteroidetes bacterium]|nr:hypothetical protein [Bacteroidota bacterium]